MSIRLSIVIPTLNEANTLPGLLEALNAQTRPADEIIVADAGSKDGTVEMAQTRGAKVVPGGRPGPGRNAGARAAIGDVLLFLDADVLPGPDFIETALAEFIEGDYAVATCLIEALGDEVSARMLAEATNMFLQVVQYFSPHAPGFCIFCRRPVHEAIGGFDEEVKLAEDHDYVQRAARHGDFGVLSNTRIAVSMRRIEKEGLTRLAIKYLWCEMYALAGKPIYSTPFEYEFGAHGVESQDSSRLIDIGRLREQLGKFENPVQRLSDKGLGTFQTFIDRDWLNGARERIELAFDRVDRDMIQGYLSQRLAIIRADRRRLRNTVEKLQKLGIKESIRLLDLNWLKSRLPDDRALRRSESESETEP